MPAQRYREILERLPSSPALVRIAGVRFDGVPLADMSIEFVGDPKFDSRFSSRFTERVVLATMAVTLNLNGEFVSEPSVRDMISRPDFAYYERGVLRFFAETSVVSSPGESARRDASAEVNALIRKALETPPIADALLGTFLSFVIPWGQLDFPRSEIAEEVITAAMQYARSNLDSLSLDLVSKDFPLLNSLGAKVYMSRSGPAFLDFTFGARSFDSRWYFHRFSQVLNSKAARFRAQQNVRLFVYFTDAMIDGMDVNALSEMARASDSSFEEIYVGYESIAKPLLHPSDV